MSRDSWTRRTGETQLPPTPPKDSGQLLAGLTPLLEQQVEDVWMVKSEGAMHQILAEGRCHPTVRKGREVGGS
ncbi:Leucine-rich repeat protein kinase family protein [Dorcoceras hygrometricum]|uniref:Leucine-rich repeat protein kinase family protein n=1 Tax=Dorcoceras hygrometricum TaxID=472368 RepID=A0A2Z7BBX9_9LAMI|nr:Leucine-rich repeat protein kinase family protein [Dorcoceras hygrometricum]